MRHPALLRTLFCLLVLLGIALPRAAAQDQPEALPADEGPVAPTESITQEEIESRLADIEASTSLSDEEIEALTTTYHEAQQHLETAESRAAQAEELEAGIASAPAQLEQAQAALAEPPPELAAPPGDDASLEAWQQYLLEQKLEQESAGDALAKLREQSATRTNRRQEIPAELNEIKDEIAELQTQLAALSRRQELDPGQQARQALLQAKLAALSSEQNLHETELRYYEATSALLPLQLALAERRFGRLEEHVASIQSEVASMRATIWEQRLTEARQQASTTVPLLSDLAARNQELAQRGEQIEADSAEARRLVDLRQAEIAELKKRLQELRQKVETLGLTRPIGVQLRHERDDLPDYRSLQRSLRDRQRAINSTLDTRFALEERSDDLEDVQREAARILAQLAIESGRDVDQLQLEEQVVALLQFRKELLAALIETYQSYEDRLFELNRRERNLIEAHDELTDYIDERIFWVRSATLLDWSDVVQSSEPISRIADPAAWQGVGSLLKKEIRGNAVSWILAALVLAGLIALRPRWRRRVEELGRRAERGTCAEFRPTADAVFWTLLLALPGPATAYFVGMRLDHASNGHWLTASLASALMLVAGPWLALEFARQVCRPHGLAECHFLWQPVAVGSLRRGLWWFMPTLLLLLLAWGVIDASGEHEWQNSLGRLLFLAGMTVVVGLCHRLLHPRRGGMQRLVASPTEGWRSPLRAFWYLLGVILPLGIIALAIAGYLFTAEQLAEKVFVTLGMLALLFFIQALLVRLVLVNHRRTAIQEFHRRREAEISDSATVRKMPDGQIISAELDPEELSRLSAQARRTVLAVSLLAAILSLWIIWRDVFPALAILDQWTLGETTSVGDMLVGLIVLVITVIATVNLPGMLEIGVLQRISMDSGLRYAITTITRYVLAIVGVSLALSWMGFGWSRLQWLIAALGVGLGFGLQEIVANFVSGLILLFERPLRVGDIVSIGDVSGKVTKIRIRATTICDWDRKELIVPNKDFVTQRLLNWTLSDQINRIVIEVGVAYGTDVRLAHDLLAQVCRENPVVLADPAPLVTLEKFADSSLNFVVRAYLPDLQNRLQTIHDLHAAIQETLMAHGIEIAFPQRDIHIRSTVAAPSGGEAGSLPGTVAAEQSSADAGQIGSEDRR